MTDVVGAKLDALLNLLTCPICQSTGEVLESGYWQGNFWISLASLPGITLPQGAKLAQRLVVCSCRVHARALLALAPERP